MAIDPSHIRLTPEQQAYIARQAERNGVTWESVLGQWIPVAKPQKTGEESAFDAARRLGLVGCSHGDPPDLATNPQYMEGFGDDVNGSSAD